MVSVSRRAFPPHFGHVVLMKSSMNVRGERESPRNSTSVGENHRQILLRHQRRIRIFRQYTTGMGQPRTAVRENEPVAQAVGHGAFSKPFSSA
jgi:hypothetical protein